MDQIRARLGVARVLLSSVGSGASYMAASRTQMCAVVEGTKLAGFRKCTATEVSSLQELAAQVSWAATEHLDAVMEALAQHTSGKKTANRRREAQDYMRVLDKFTQQDWDELLPRGEGDMQAKKRCILRRALLLNLTVPNEGTAKLLCALWC